MERAQREHVLARLYLRLQGSLNFVTVQKIAQSAAGCSFALYRNVTKG